MSGSDWPANPNDPECPACGEPVSATATYCMHCYADLPTGGAGPAEATARGRPAATTSAPAETTADMREADPGMPTADVPDGRSGWLHPDSAFDDVSTAAVGIVGGILDGFLLLLLAIWLFPRSVQSSWGLSVAVVGWLVTTAWIARTRTVFGAVRKAAYSLALLVALTPPFVAYALGDASALFFGVLVWPVAAIVTGVGWAAGHGALDEDG